ncbi:response regulator transcription factor [Dyella soli]|uniref:Response regulator transcription factor n=1 Tax=Dyella soli TaxID=522319 RepID=A0A4R0Z021_9GAMM|nr:response regulator [Dyella soli]TCI11204.1 response regulator transcription factor [Dyella soli]
METELICVLDDDEEVRSSLESLLRAAGYGVQGFATPEEFLACDAADTAVCLVLDVQLGSVNGLDFQQELVESETPIPVILISGHGDIPMTVRAMRAGAVTFLPKPFEERELLAAVQEAAIRDRNRRAEIDAFASVRAKFDSLSAREREVFGLVTSGLLNKQIAGRLKLSEITVKIHRGNLMRKMRAESLANLVRMAEALGIREAVSRYKHD